jgi:hypothetical protein
MSSSKKLDIFYAPPSGRDHRLSHPDRDFVLNRNPFANWLQWIPTRSWDLWALLPKIDAESLDVANVTASQSCVGMHAEEPTLHFEVVLAEMTPFQSRG